MTTQFHPQDTVTLLLQRAEAEKRPPVDAVLPFVYDELRSLAHIYLMRERQADTLSTTALVHEAYLRLVNEQQVSARGRSYFFGAAARAMRQILVDHARRRKSIKRGGGQRASTLGSIQLSVDEFAADLMDLENALQQLSADFPRQADVVEFRFFGGMSIEEVADALDLSPTTVKHDWGLARAWLFRYLHAQ